MRCVSSLLLLCLLFAGAARAQGPEFQYLLHCGGCHIEDGSGMGNVVPDLRLDLGYLASIPEGRAYVIQVPGASQAPVTNVQLAEITNWMLSRFAPDYDVQPFDEAEVAELRSTPLNDVAGTRKALLGEREREREEGYSLQEQGASAAESGDQASLEPGYLKLDTEQWESFGRLLFMDTSLSVNGSQSCASCHDPGRAFTDREAALSGRVASLGADRQSLGDRIAPMLTYAALVPSMQWSATDAEDPQLILDGIIGGQFWDGRATDLAEQVMTPFVNPREMALGDLDELADRVLEAPHYRSYLNAELDRATTLVAVSQALVAYLSSDELNSFDSRYDRFLRGEIQPTQEEVIGMGLFFSPSFANCATCHQSQPTPYARSELFTHHGYENIGVPVNQLLRQSNGKGGDYRDPGLAANPQVAKQPWHAAAEGRFRVPSLRNVAVTAPYMHNGAFSELSTVLAFYNHFNHSGDGGRLNPETGLPWSAAETPDTVDMTKLRSGFPLSPRQLDALQAFLNMLTDQRYEHLLAD